ncbi:MAG: PKD domain-containing protein [Cyclobacteriaceae bacterium]|jgi:hypothetical protein|nr:PKD domain-containing protein [Cyclobacteriaceae bacterium]
MKRLLLFISFLVPGMAGAQEAACEAAAYFQRHPECGSEGRGAKCLQLDITHSLDRDGKPFVFAWNFGDGTTQQGPLTEYCYQRYGTYQITLDLIDPQTRQVIHNELSTQVTLLPPVDVAIDTLRDRSAVFKYDPELLPGLAVEHVYWKIENRYYCGESIRHAFANPGLHMIEIAAVGKTADKMSFNGCTLRGVFVAPKP